MKYYANIDLSVENNSHTQAFKFINRISNGKKLRVLEVGCSGGYFGRALMDCGHYVVGVEPDHGSYLHAAGHLNEAYQGYLDEYFEAHPDQRFDIITFGDVLEHLVDPLGSLIKSRFFLNQSGYVIASVPNVAHSSVRAMLVEGRWDYVELGLMDKTHLRFFTRSTLIDLFSNASYRVDGIKSVRLTAQQVDLLTGMNLKPASVELVEAFADDDRIHDFQYVLMATPVGAIELAEATNGQLKNYPSDGLRIMCLLPDITSTLVDLRLKRPLQFWAEYEGAQVQFRNIHELDARSLLWADIYIFHRVGDATTTSIMENLRANGKKIIFDMDDLLTDIPVFLSHHQISKEDKVHLVKAISEADVLTVSTPALLEQLSFNKNAFVVPNCTIDVGNPIIHSDVPFNEVNILIASSDLISVDFLVEPLRFVQDRYGVTIHVIGPPSTTFTDAGLAITAHALFNYDDFKAFLRRMDNTIGIIPLDDSLFSSCKSPIKYFDYSLAGIPTLCSDVLPYNSHVKHDLSGILVQNNFETICQGLVRLIENWEMRREIAANAREQCLSENNYFQSLKNWNNVFSQIKSAISWPRTKSLSLLTYPVPKRNKMKWIIRHLKSPSSYSKLQYIIKNNGFKGIFEIFKKRYN